MSNPSISRRRQNWRALLVVFCAAATACATVPAARPGDTTVYIVRHAEKATPQDGNPDVDISDLGQARAGALADRLASAGVTAIIVTDLRRTEQTALPLATRSNISPEIVPLIVSLRSHADSVAAAVLRHRGGAVLVIGHTNTVPVIINALGGPRIHNLCDTEFSNLFVLTIHTSGEPHFQALHYGSPDPIDVRCH